MRCIAYSSQANLPHVYVLGTRKAFRGHALVEQLLLLGFPVTLCVAEVFRGELNPQKGTNAKLYLGRDLTNSEIGCLESHKEIYQKISHQEEDYALILEDDAILLTNFLNSISFIQSQKSLVRNSVITLNHSVVISKRFSPSLFYANVGAQRFMKHLFMDCVIPPYGTVSYFLSRDVARKISNLDLLYLSPADWPPEWSSLVRFIAVNPPCIQHPPIAGELYLEQRRREIQQRSKNKFGLTHKLRKVSSLIHFMHLRFSLAKALSLHQPRKTIKTFVLQELLHKDSWILKTLYKVTYTPFMDSKGEVQFFYGLYAGRRYRYQKLWRNIGSNEQVKREREAVVNI